MADLARSIADSDVLDREDRMEARLRMRRKEWSEQSYIVRDAGREQAVPMSRPPLGW